MANKRKYMLTDLLHGNVSATSGRLLIADGNNWVSVALSGDATVTSGGALTVAAGAIGGSKIDMEAATAPTADTVSSAAGVVSTAFAATYTIPANRLLVGSVVRVRAHGEVTAQAGAVTLQLTLRVGGVTVGTVNVAQDVALNDPWMIDAEVVVGAIGASGTFSGGCYTTIGVYGGIGTSTQIWGSSFGAAVNTTVPSVVDVLVGWSAGVGNTVRLNSLTVQVLN